MQKILKITIYGVIALALIAILGFTTAHSAKADFFDLLNPTEPGNIIDPFCIFCDDSNGVEKPELRLFTDNPNLAFNDSTLIRWNSRHATSCTASGGANGWAGSKNLFGPFSTGNLTSTTTYNLTCTNSAGAHISRSVTVNVSNAPVIENPTVNIYATPISVSYNGSSTVYWNSNNATFCNASGGANGWAGSKNTSGTFYTGTLTNTVTFSITCTNSTNSVTESVTIHVDNNDNNNDDQDPTVDIRADDTSIDFDDSTTIRWSSNNADYCRASDGDNGWSGSKNTSGTFYTGDLTDDTTYRITCYNNSDSANDSITIRVDDDNDSDNDNNDEAPDVTTRSATNANANSATLNGRVDGNGSSVRAWFEYGTNYNLSYSTSSNSYGSGSKNFNKNISGLLPNTTYYFRAVAENSEDTTYGNTLSFNTGSNYVNIINNQNTQPTVVISADSNNLAFNGATNIRWFTTNATSCFASNGSIGWAGVKSIGPGSFYTGSLTLSRTYTITCTNEVGSSTDSTTVNVRGQVLGATTTRDTTPPGTSLVLINSSIDRNQPIIPTLDNTKPRPGDEINYSVGYQNIGTGSITGLTLQVALPQEVSYMSSNGNSPSVFGNVLVFNLGTLKANSQGLVTVRVLVRNNVAPGTILNFPATLSYVDPSNFPKSVNANVSAQVWNAPVSENTDDNLSPLGANAFTAGFLPVTIAGWLLLVILILVLVVLAKHLFGSMKPLPYHQIPSGTPVDHH